MKAAVRLNEVSYTYPGRAVPAADRINLEIPKGKITALLGPNGCGKTTLLDLILGWKKPDSGAVFLNERPVKSYTKRERSMTVSLVAQNEPVQFSFSVLDYVLFGRAPYMPQLGVPGTADIAAASASLQRVGMEEYSRRSIAALSSGERQLVFIARSLAQDPDILLLDEPTSSLDPANTAAVLTLMKTVSGGSMTILFSTHDPSAAAEAADCIVMLREGILFASGSSADVLTGKNLSRLYGTEFEVFTHKGRQVLCRGGRA